MRRALLLVVFLRLSSTAEAQPPSLTSPDPPASAPVAGSRDVMPARESIGVAGRGEYRIGVDDVLSIAVLQATELNTSVRVSEQGTISLPLLGTVHALGLTTQQLELQLEDLLRAKYIRNPDVTIMATEVRSQAVSVGGAVRHPGLVQIRGTATLLEAISLAGGLADDAGDTVMVVRNSTLAGVEAATSQVAGDIQTPGFLEIKLKPLMASRTPESNVPVYPGDVVNVQSAAVVYVIGAVNKPGAFAMRGNDRLTVLRALALGEGLAPIAASGDATVLRTNASGDRVELDVNLSGILKGKVPDMPLEPQDVLFVPVSGGKVAARTALDMFARALSRGLVPYRW
jgi:polysaccharide biosynthesis/export protein